MVKRKSRIKIKKELRNNPHFSPNTRKLKGLKGILELKTNGSILNNRELRSLLKKAGYRILQGTNNHDLIYNPLGEILRKNDSRPLILSNNSRLRTGTYNDLISAMYKDISRIYPELI